MTNIDQRIAYLNWRIEQQDRVIDVLTTHANYHRFNFNEYNDRIARSRKRRSLLKHQLLIARLRRWFSQLTKW